MITKNRPREQAHRFGVALTSYIFLLYLEILHEQFDVYIMDSHAGRLPDNDSNTYKDVETSFRMNIFFKLHATNTKEIAFCSSSKHLKNFRAK